MKFFLGIITFCLGLLVGGKIPIEQQLDIYSLIGGSAAVIIGITGAWYAVLLPEIIASLRREEEETYTHAIELHKRLLKPMVMGIGLFSISLLIRVLKPAVDVALIWGHEQIAAKFQIISLNALNIWCLRGSFGVCLVLTGWLLWILICLLRPYDYLKTFIDKKEKEKDILKKLGPSAEASDD
ncbi:hypothetical protein LF599_16835 [Pseudodesulfovibrio thermohalotolerans]|uniref:hypothetical protein n=1 Tax=Pseudodesulfovibrio thermohalotolerans TaxID=2880651 RepID=UPI0024418817|nr:hypothetical protein [Pseudodesulfovibrio thermohalotolerans]WFS62304.1 hypothetical protein LF599_16835 [Pseudodesulfovibrio thermohalotolerans]